MPTRVSAEARITVPVAQAWAFLRDLPRANQYGPGVTECTITTERREGVGASRRVVSKAAGPMDETVTEWNEGNGFVIRLHRGEGDPAIFRDASFRYAIEADGDGTRATLTLSYAPKGGPLGGLIDWLFLRRFTAKNVRETALGLARHYEASAAAHSE